MDVFLNESKSIRFFLLNPAGGIISMIGSLLLVFPEPSALRDLQLFEVNLFFGCCVCRI